MNVLSSDFGLLGDAKADEHPAFPAFKAAMAGRAYGRGPLNSAWAWFKSGYEASAASATADPAMPPPDVIEAMAKVCSCCRECQSVPCAGAMAGACDVAECHCHEESESEEEDFDRNTCPGCGGGCQVACR